MGLFDRNPEGGGLISPVSVVAEVLAGGGGSGTVTSVAASVPSFLSISGSPITTAGTLAISYSGTALPAINGGTAQTTYATGDLLYASGVNTLSKLAAGTNTHVLTLAGGVPTWAAPTGGGGATTELDNLGVTAINADLDPATGNSVDLGQVSKAYKNGYINRIDLVTTGGVANGRLRASSVGLPSGASAQLFLNALLTANLGLYTVDKTGPSDHSTSIYFETGNAIGTTANSGDLNFYIGTATGTQGEFKFLKGGAAPTIGHVWTCTAVDGSGYWAAAAGGGGDLWSDAVDSHILPTGASNTYDIGGAGAFMKVVYANDFRGPKIRLTDATDSQSNHLEITGSSSTSPEGTSYGVAMKTSQSTAADSLGIWTRDTSTSATGSISIQTGNATAGGGDNSGDIQLWIGTATATQGSFKFLKSGVAPTIGDVWTCSAVDGSGYWAAAAGGGGVNANDVALQWRNQADTLDLDVIRLNTSNQFELDNSVLAFVPEDNIGADFGTSIRRWNQGHINEAFIRNLRPVPSGTTTLNIETVDGSGTGPVSITTGNASASNSGNITIQTGTAAGTRGNININAKEINMAQSSTVNVVWKADVTGSRPLSPLTGERYFDTTLGIPIWYDGTNWIDAAGTTV